MSAHTFSNILDDVLEHLSQQKDIYVNHNLAGAHQKYHVDIRLVSPSPHHCLFAQHMFREINHDFSESEGYTIIHAPKFEVDSTKHATRSSTVIVTNIEERVILIAGSLYASGSASESSSSTTPGVGPRMRSLGRAERSGSGGSPCSSACWWRCASILAQRCL